jgi:hypothetical protein
MLERKNNNLLWPSIYGSSREEDAEMELVQEILPKYLTLKRSGIINEGSKTAVLASNTDGYGKYSHYDKFGADLAAYRIRDRIGDELTIIKDATSQDLKSVIQNPDYQNIVVIGHASYHNWRASDRSVNWYDLGKMVGSHLKDGVFINVGCGQITSWNWIPLGYFVVNNPQNLFGKKAEYIFDDELLNPLNNIQRLQPRLSFIPQT